jgi:flagella basal body P-ring formation protein FlgA
MNSILFHSLIWTLALLGSASAQTRKSTPKPSERISITLRAESWVRGRSILLGDIASVVASDKQVQAELRQIRIGDAPKGSWPRAIDRSDVLNILRDKSAPLNRIVLAGPDQIRVKTENETISWRELVRSAEEALKKLLEEAGDTDTTWQLLREPRDIRVPMGRESRRLVPELVQGKLRGNFASYRVTVLVDGEQETTVSIQFRVRRYQELVVATRAIRAGTKFDYSDLEVRRVEVTQRLGSGLKMPEEAIGMIAALQLRAGQIVTERHMSKPALVHKGDVVTIVAAVGKVRVTAEGVAREDGHEGQRIAVQIGDRKMPVYGTVTGHGIVEVRRPSVRRGRATPASHRK